MTIYCGIDLGTTNSTVSVIQAKKRESIEIEDRLKTLPIYQYDENFQITKNSINLPSALYFDLDNKNIYTGIYAKRIYGDGDRPMQSIRAFKTRIGGDSLVEIPGITNENNKMYFDMVECSALLLKTIKVSVEKQYGEAITGAVVTVPAAFNNDERQATKNAMLLAGFKEVHILDEPTAALLYYINKNSDIDSAEIGEEEEYRLVYDIGGGTLDVSIAKMYETEDIDVAVEIVARSPRMDLGGNDFDQYLASYFLGDFEKTRTPIENRSIEDQNRIIARLVSHAEREKIEVNEKIKSAIGNERKIARLKQFVNFEVIDNMNISNIKLTKPIVEEIFSELILTAEAKILKPVKESLRYANIEKGLIKEVILTGGMSNFFAIEESLRGFFEDDIVIKYVDTESSVSKGAAIYHYHLSGEEEGIKLKMEDKLADDIFINIGNDFPIFISRTVQANDVGTFEYEIQDDGLCEIAIFLYYGQGNSPENYTPISGRYLELKKPKSKGDVIKLEWSFDSNKMISIKVKELGEQIEIRSSNELTAELIRDNHINTLRINGEEI